MKMGKKVREYKSGDFIFAKVKGYPAWPARVQKPNGKKYFVYFYGTGETANLPPNMIFDYAENKDKFLNKSVKRKDFNDGVKQIEHDFSNNVPLEEVIGALASAEPSPADDTLNESANNTADDSAIADTTADDTIDENAANSTVNDAPVEDSDDAGALVIDEGKQKGRKSTKPATPKAKEVKTPRGRPKKEESKEVEEEQSKKEEEIVSRSGRKIRPKRYIDEQTEENTTLPSPAPKKRRGASPTVEKEKPEPKEKPQDKNIRAYNTVQQSELRDLKEPFKSADSEKENILITYLPSGEYCGVKLFTGRPTSFKNEAAKLQWDKQAASNAITLKRQLEKGQITPQSISAQLVMDLNLTDEEKATLDRDRDLEMKKARLHFLKTEMKLIELDAKIKTCISLEKADTELCLKLIDEILELDLAALMLLKHPTCMETVKRMRVYVGNTPSWEMTETEALTFSKQAHHIRNKADALFITMRDLFDVPEGLSFWEYFHERVAQFKAATEKLHADKLLEMVHEPIELSQPAHHTMKAAVDAANEDEPAEDDAAQKKKATPAKGKKASTPSKTPLKRQSSRKQQDDKDKETEKPKETELEDIQEEPTKANDADKSESTDTNKKNNQNNDQSEKVDEAEKTNENNTEDKADKSNENSEKDDGEKMETDETEDNVAGSEKAIGDSAKSSSNEKDEKSENSLEKSKEKGEAETTEDGLQKDEEIDDNKDGKNSKDSKKKDEKNSNSDKSSKKEKVETPKEDAKNSKDKGKPGDKRKEKAKDEKEKSEEKEKVDVDEPRAKRSRESKKTEPPPRSPAKRKSKS